MIFFIYYIHISFEPALRLGVTPKKYNKDNGFDKSLFSGHAKYFCWKKLKDFDSGKGFDPAPDIHVP